MLVVFHQTIWGVAEDPKRLKDKDFHAFGLFLVKETSGFYMPKIAGEPSARAAVGEVP